MNDAVVGAVGVTGLTVFLAEGYLNNYQNWIVAKTHGTTYTQKAPTVSFWKWALGLGVVAVVLTAAADSPSVGPLAKGFAFLIAGTVLLAPPPLGKGQQAMFNLRALVAP